MESKLTSDAVSTVSIEQVLCGRETSMPSDQLHVVFGLPLNTQCPSGLEFAYFAMGCFWGAERIFWQQDGVYLTAVGYCAGITPNPTYKEVCSGRTAHTEVVMVMYDPLKVNYLSLLTLFWQSHNPTQGYRQGNDSGTQYRSGLYTVSEEQHVLASETKAIYNSELSQHGHDAISTEILPFDRFYFAEPEHQQYLAVNPNGYCGLGGLGIDVPKVSCGK